MARHHPRELGARLVSPLPGMEDDVEDHVTRLDVDRLPGVERLLLRPVVGNGRRPGEPLRLVWALRELRAGECPGEPQILALHRGRQEEVECAVDRLPVGGGQVRLLGGRDRRAPRGWRSRGARRRRLFRQEHGDERAGDDEHHDDGEPAEPAAHARRWRQSGHETEGSKRGVGDIVSLVTFRWAVLAAALFASLAVTVAAAAPPPLRPARRRVRVDERVTGRCRASRRASLCPKVCRAAFLRGTHVRLLATPGAGLEGRVLHEQLVQGERGGLRVRSGARPRLRPAAPARSARSASRPSSSGDMRGGCRCCQAL